MPEETIVCPNCGHEIPLTEALTTRVEERLRSDFEKQLFAERVKAQAKAREELAVEQANLQAELMEKATKLEESQKHELDLLKKTRELQESQQSLDLEFERRLQEEKVRAEKATENRLAEEHKLRDLEKEKQLADLREQITDLKRKAEQGSQQSQGDAAEIDLDSFLRSTFPQDDIERVPKGVRGADLIQTVIGPGSRITGKIVWEVKNTKAWSDGWLEQLRDNQRDCKADLAAIVSTVLPKEVRHFGSMGGVWVADPSALSGMATALRSQLIQVAMVRTAAEGRGTKMDDLYDYLTGEEFRQRVAAIVEAWVTMEDDLNRERRAMERGWAKRDKNIKRALSGIAGMHGDIQGIVGASLPKVSYLELPAAEEAEGIDGSGDAVG